MIKFVANHKDKSKIKIQLLGMPSLLPDMYHQNVLNAFKGNFDGAIKFFAPANDPFATANSLKKIVNFYNNDNRITNIYLSPLSTKAQALGFALFYLWELRNKNASIIFPFCRSYNPETSKGLFRVWKYEIVLPVE